MTIQKNICSHHDAQAFQHIRSHADLQAQQGIRSDGPMLVDILSLESVRYAHESYALLRPLSDLESCVFPDLNRFSIVACLSLELHKIEHDMLPTLQDPEAKLDGRMVQTLISLKNSATTLFHLGEEFEGQFDREEVQAVFSGRVKEVGVVLVDTADQVLKGTHNIVWLKERVPLLVDLFSTLMATPLFLAR